MTDDEEQQAQTTPTNAAPAKRKKRPYKARTATETTTQSTTAPLGVSFNPLPDDPTMVRIDIHLELPLIDAINLAAAAARSQSGEEAPPHSSAGFFPTATPATPATPAKTRWSAKE